MMRLYQVKNTVLLRHLLLWNSFHSAIVSSCIPTETKTNGKFVNHAACIEQEKIKEITAKRADFYRAWVNQSQVRMYARE